MTSSGVSNKINRHELLVIKRIQPELLRHGIKLFCVGFAVGPVPKTGRYVTQFVTQPKYLLFQHYSDSFYDCKANPGSLNGLFLRRYSLTRL